MLDETQLDERLAEAFATQARRDAAPHQDAPRELLRRRAALAYDDFFGEVERTRYDIELLVEHVRDDLRDGRAPRLQPRAIPKRPGMPFHFLRCDIAGNISKRYSAPGCASPRAAARARSGRCTRRS